MLGLWFWLPALPTEPLRAVGASQAGSKPESKSPRREAGGRAGRAWAGKRTAGPPRPSSGLPAPAPPGSFGQSRRRPLRLKGPRPQAPTLGLDPPHATSPGCSDVLSPARNRKDLSPPAACPSGGPLGCPQQSSGSAGAGMGHPFPAQRPGKGRGVLSRGWRAGKTLDGCSRSPRSRRSRVKMWRPPPEARRFPPCCLMCSPLQRFQLLLRANECVSLLEDELGLAGCPVGGGGAGRL